LSLLLMLSIVTASSATEFSAAVETLDIREETDAVEFTITSTEPVRYTYFELDGPRLVVDFHNAENLLGFLDQSVGKAGVRSVRAAAFTNESRDVTRIVFDLEGPAPYQIVDDGDGLVHVRFGEIDDLSVESAASDFTQANSNSFDLNAGIPVPAAFGSVQDSDAQEAIDADTGFEVVVEELQEVDVVEPLEELIAVEQSQESEIAVDPVVLIASTAPTPLPPAQTAAPAVSPAAFARIETGVQPFTVESPVVEVQAPLTRGAGAAPPALLLQEDQVGAESGYTGEIVSFNLVGSDMRDFFRVIAELSGLNIILDAGVAGQLTLVLTEVPWDQALDLVLRTENLGYELQGNILRIAPQATLQAEEDALRALRDAQELNVPLETRPYIMSYTTADAVGGMVAPLLSPAGTSIVDPRRNALIITEVPSRFDRIESLIAFLDTPAQQVEIEARLLSATKSFSRELGSLLGLEARNSANPGNTANFNSNLLGPANGTLQFILGNGGDILLDGIITAAEANGTAKLLSRPRVVTQNNVPATVSQGTQIPVQTNVNNTISVQFMPFNLSLAVTPQITDAGTILLNAIIENSSPDFGRAVGGVPSISTQQASTTVLIPDGGTAVVGGILIDNDSVNTSQIPGLGSIPVIGNLFKSTSTVKSTSELLFFITARIKATDPLEFLSGAVEDESELFGALADSTFQ